MLGEVRDEVAPMNKVPASEQQSNLVNMNLCREGLCREERICFTFALAMPFLCF